MFDFDQDDIDRAVSAVVDSGVDQDTPNPAEYIVQTVVDALNAGPRKSSTMLHTVSWLRKCLSAASSLMARGR